MSRIQLITMGCRLNAFESEALHDHAEAAGLGETVIVNSCAVTAEAVRQARQAIRKAKRNNPDARVIVTGCAAQIEPESFARMPEIDHVLGNREKLDPESFKDLGAKPRLQVSDIMNERRAQAPAVTGFRARARAYLQIQNGCDHRCTFCVIPFGRGPSRSVPADQVIAQARALMESGHKEIVLTGVDITAYGADLECGSSLGELVCDLLAALPELPRLRLSSIDSIEADHALLDAIADEPRLMPHLHLSLQAGDNVILKRMKRRHSRDDAIAFCRKVRDLRPDVVFGADLIAGFPTETDDMFQASLDLIEQCGLSHLHVFPFSPRPGTPAARMPQLPGDVIKARARALRGVGHDRLTQTLRGMIGTRQPVLVETNDTGRTPHFAIARLEGTAAPGTIINAEMLDIADNGLRAMAVA